MDATVISINKTDSDGFADSIAAAWSNKQALEAGRHLITARQKLARGSFMAMLRNELPFKNPTAFCLMAAAKHPVLLDPVHAEQLPASWVTLYELSKLPQAALLAGLQDGSIHPGISRRGAAALSSKKNKPKPMVQSKPSQAQQPMAIQYSKEQRMRVVENLMRSLNLSIMDWISIKENRS